MSIKVFAAQSVSANTHIHIAKFTDASVSAGLANERTLFFGRAASPNVPILHRDVRLTVDGTFSDGSGTAAMGIDFSPNASAGNFIVMTSISADFTSTYPMHAGDAFRLRLRVVGSAASASIDAFIS